MNTVCSTTASPIRSNSRCAGTNGKHIVSAEDLVLVMEASPNVVELLGDRVCINNADELHTIGDDAMTMSEGYRQRIYEQYASGFQDASEVFDTGAATRWGKAYDYYFRNWLPADPTATILEVACGGGRLLHFLKTRGYVQVSGVDISPEQVRLARQVVETVEEAHVIAFLEKHKNTYELIIGLDIVEHFHKDEALRFLDACYTALRPGGSLILQTPNADSPLGMMSRYGDFTHEIGFNPNSLTRLLRMIGFCAMQSRELGPVPLGYGMISTIRVGLWKVIRGMLKLWNLIEIGHSGSGVFTRIFLVSARKSLHLKSAP
jgi:2-polyprenyl-3-methyl-5-hydroxy-6-metoxy-1,4-benzoquinol methylase